MISKSRETKREVVDRVMGEFTPEERDIIARHRFRNLWGMGDPLVQRLASAGIVTLGSWRSAIWASERETETMRYLEEWERHREVEP